MGRGPPRWRPMLAEHAPARREPAPKPMPLSGPCFPHNKEQAAALHTPRLRNWIFLQPGAARLHEAFPQGCARGSAKGSAPRGSASLCERRRSAPRCSAQGSEALRGSARGSVRLHKASRGFERLRENPLAPPISYKIACDEHRFPTVWTRSGATALRIPSPCRPSSCGVQCVSASTVP